jgi:N-methylhydantoinase A
MERALRVISVERGFDPSEFVLTAFGGAGALHVTELVERLGAARALVPPDPGLLSAYGMLAASPTREVSRTLLLTSDAREGPDELDDAFRGLERQAVSEMEEEGNPADTLTLRRWVDARYRGQSFELRVPGEEWIEAFHLAHRERYGYARKEAPVEAVTLRVVAEAPPPTLTHPPLEEARKPPPSEEARVVYRGNEVAGERVWRRDLRAGHVLRGPLLVLEYSSTTWLPPEWRMEVDARGSLHLMKE